jgi:hypothetical protein
MNTINLTINGLVLNNFTETDSSAVSLPSIVDNLCEQELTGIPNIIRDIHFNYSYPQNNNIKFLTEQISERYINNGWSQISSVALMTVLIERIEKGYRCYINKNRDEMGVLLTSKMQENEDMFSNFKSNIAEITKLINKEDKGKGINEDAWNSVLKIICDISNQYYKELSNMKDNYINTTTNKAIES